jgi:hypothetical protein
VDYYRIMFVAAFVFALTQRREDFRRSSNGKTVTRGRYTEVADS